MHRHVGLLNVTYHVITMCIYSIILYSQSNAFSTYVCVRVCVCACMCVCARVWRACATVTIGVWIIYAVTQCLKFENV